MKSFLKPSYEDVAELLEYNPETGKLIWKVNRRGKAVAGTEAGYIEKTKKGKATTYRRVYINNKQYQCHHVAVLLMTGQWPEMVDHDDHDGLNNKWNNLNVTCITGNNKNRKFKPNQTGHTGIYKNPKSKGFYVSIGSNGKAKYRGTRDTLEAAIELRDSIYAQEGFHILHGELK